MNSYLDAADARHMATTEVAYWLSDSLGRAGTWYAATLHMNAEDGRPEDIRKAHYAYGSSVHKNGADDGIRTRDPRLGKPMLYR
jgi:hypothetical protein